MLPQPPDEVQDTGASIIGRFAAVAPLTKLALAPAQGRAFLWGFGLALLLGLVLAVVQLAALGAWRVGASGPAIAWQPVSQAPLEALPDGSWRLAPTQGAGGILVTGLDLSADGLLGLRWRIEAHPQPVEVEIAWLRVGRDRPDTARFTLPPAAHDRTVRFDLTGHPLWRGPVSRLAIALRSPPSVVPWTAGSPELVAATPSAGLGWVYTAWFLPERLLQPAGAVTRILPLAVLGVLVVLVLAGGGAIARRRVAPPAFASALLGAAGAGLLALLGLGIVLLSARIVPASTVTLALLAVALPVLVAAWAAPAQPTGEAEPRSTVARPVLVTATVVLVALLVLATARPWLGLISASALLVWALATRWGDRGRALIAGGGLAATLVLFTGIQAQSGGMIGRAIQTVGLSPGAFAALSDPTPRLVAALGAGWPLAVGFVLLAALAWLWPTGRARHRTTASATSQGQHSAAPSVLALVAAGALAALAFALGSPGWPELLAPAVGWLAVASAQRLALPLAADHAATARAAVPLAERSPQVQSLYRAAIGAFLTSAAQRELRDAARHLERAREIAPDEPETRWAQLALALAEGEPARAEAAYRSLLDEVPLATRHVPTDQMHHTLYEAAWARGDLDALALLEPVLPPSATRVRIACRLALEREGPAAMWRVLEEAGFPAELILERIECALLLDDIERAKQALEASGIPIASLAGQCYLARLKLRALGPKAAEAEIMKLATWNADFALAQLAMGELLARQGQMDAARVRLRAARALDPALWTAHAAARREVAPLV